ncbi:hypothetical protein WMY93_022700 [Mugilogobius chulae]|uniref:SH3 domain-containing protein n=1 Tax=Mugilogobius chulae TaxID=88201 RepID=A0AAW0N8U8_9GOBI
MAANRIIRVPTTAMSCHAAMPSPSVLRLDTSSSLGAVQEVVAIKDYCPSSFTTLKFSKGDRLFVLDTSGGEWWYAHNNTEMGYIPATYVQPIHFRSSTLSDSGMIDGFGEDNDEGLKEFGEWTNGTVQSITNFVWILHWSQSTFARAVSEQRGLQNRLAEPPEIS